MTTNNAFMPRYIILVIVYILLLTVFWETEIKHWFANMLFGSYGVLHFFRLIGALSIQSDVAMKSGDMSIFVLMTWQIECFISGLDLVLIIMIVGQWLPYTDIACWAGTILAVLECLSNRDFKTGFGIQITVPKETDTNKEQ